MAELTKEEVKEYLEHFPKIISEELVNYAINTVFLKSRYIFTHREKKQQYGYCTYCKSEFETEGLKHNSKTICPKCYSDCTVKASGRGRKYMEDNAYFVFYEKSVIDKDVIVARGIDASRNYRGDFKNVETKYTVRTYYIFDTKNKKGIMLAEPTWWGSWVHRQVNLQQYKTVYSYFHKYNSTKLMYQGVSRDSIKEAVKDTPFSWSGWEQYDHEDMVKFFDLFCKYPCIEYLTKLGFTHLVRGKLEGETTYRAINWNGKNLFNVLKISKQDLKGIKEKNIHASYLCLYLLQRSKKFRWDISLEDIKQLEYIAGYCRDIKELDELFKGISVKKALTYLEKQKQKFKKHFSYNSSSFQVWKDYIRDCKILEMDLTKENVIFPKNLYTAHQNTIKQVEYKENLELNLKIEKRLKKISDKYNFESRGLIIRPATSTKELIDEGKALHHCVGGYADRYAKGETIILVIRKVEEVDKPYYTVEIKGNEIRQVRGKHNRQPTEDVEKFIEEFKENKLTKKSNKKNKISKEKLAIPA